MSERPRPPGIRRDVHARFLRVLARVEAAEREQAASWEGKPITATGTRRWNGADRPPATPPHPGYTLNDPIGGWISTDPMSAWA